MSSEPIDPVSQDRQELDEQLSRTLVLLYRLSTEAIEQINELMSTLRIRFADAALKSGAVTPQQLEEALEWINQRALIQSRGVIEEVLHRTARKRDVILWEGDQLEPSPEIILAHNPEHPRSETVRSLRTQLLLRCKGWRGSGMIALLSPCGCEGRSQLAAELAISFAQLGRRTLLVDADLRRPNQHRLFGADNGSGLAQALTSGGSHHFHGVQGLPEMALLTSGEVPSNPLELLSGSGFERAMREWRRKFEFVILDTPPTTQFSDGLAVAAVAGSVLVLARAEATKFNDLTEICRHLGSTNSRILGAVINRF
jgi:protein-tyrosine kinase